MGSIINGWGRSCGSSRFDGGGGFAGVSEEWHIDVLVDVLVDVVVWWYGGVVVWVDGRMSGCVFDLFLL
jgi:hypothetical protein